jgi:hypothetical protein
LTRPRSCAIPSAKSLGDHALFLGDRAAVFGTIIAVLTFGGENRVRE